MTQATITKVKNQTITLPKTWKGSSVLVRVSGDTATITKVKASKNIFSPAEVKSLRRLGRKISKATLKKALGAR